MHEERGGIGPAAAPQSGESAEKLHAIVKLGIANTRMKDFFDLYSLATERPFDGEILAKAITRTFRRRKTAVSREPVGLTFAFFDDAAKQKQWSAFLRKKGAAAAELPIVGERLRKFLLPLLTACAAGEPWRRVWRDSAWRIRRKA